MRGEKEEEGGGEWVREEEGERERGEGAQGYFREVEGGRREVRMEEMEGWLFLFAIFMKKWQICRGRGRGGSEEGKRRGKKKIEKYEHQLPNSWLQLDRKKTFVSVGISLRPLLNPMGIYLFVCLFIFIFLFK